MLPNLLVIGAMKAGTDSLWEYLRAHPQVFMSKPKELDFFVKELNWDRGLDWYASHFQAAGDARVIGEASTSYSKWPVHEGVPARVASLLPDAYLVYLVRHPIDRIRSQYLHQRLLGLEQRPIDEAVLTDPSYLNLSRYNLQLQQYLDYFEASNILLLVSEELKQKRRSAMTRLAHFLKIDDSWQELVVAQEFHSTADNRVLRSVFNFTHMLPGYKAVARRVPVVVKEKTFALRTRGIDPSRFVLSDEVRRRLMQEIHDDVRELRSYLGDQFDCWGIA
jgi:hypothetical protein